VDVLLSAHLSDPRHKKLKADWGLLHHKLSDLLPVRNAIAHQPVKRTGKNFEDKPVYEYAIYPEPFRRYSQKTPKGFGNKQELLTKDLEKHAAEAASVEADLKSFIRSMRLIIKDGS
jgi:hypothetical protein